jgi:vacuolar-type H+-ATPase subunit E/Vma4
MGYRKLIDSLRTEGAEKVRLIRRKSEEDAEGMRSDMTQKIERLEEQYSRRLSTEVSEVRGSVLAEAQTKKRQKRLLEEKALSERLYSLAQSSLDVLRDERHGEVFSALVGEFPSLPWRKIRVHADDVEIARNYFSNSDVTPDEAITGGLDASSEDGSIRIVNTFNKRLERAWEDMLPELLSDIYNELSYEETPSKS